MLKIQLLQAGIGDCIIIEYGKENRQHYIIIDSGTGKNCVKELKAFINKITPKSEKVDLMILTHYDDDHINGFLNLAKHKLINSDTIKCFWMNFGVKLSEKLEQNQTLTLYVKESSCETTSAKGKELAQFLSENCIVFNSIIISGQEYNIDNAKITILSPSKEQLQNLLYQIKEECGYLIINESIDKSCDTAGISTDYSDTVEKLVLNAFNEDNSVSNCSSIAFIFEYNSIRILMLGDAAPSQIVDSLKTMGYSKNNKLKVDCCKISHHGSKRNTSNELIEMIDCHNYLISSNWNSLRPNKECLSRIVMHSERPINFYCNYKPKEFFTAEEIKKYNISFYVLNKDGIILEE